LTDSTTCLMGREEESGDNPATANAPPAPKTNSKLIAQAQVWAWGEKVFEVGESAGCKSQCPVVMA
ncbi:MAG: hypothetical protein HQ455_06620, partial [Burkholderiales bacterium]|nr:hypothetical protein [Burkholderiales bacterium]